MKTLTATLMAFALVLGFAFLGNDTAQAQLHGNGYRVGGFVDENGDGFNDLAPDSDGDGIPNGQDPDYNPPQDGSGNRFGNAGNRDGGNVFQRWYRNMYQWFKGAPEEALGQGPGHGYGPGDGSGNDGISPHDGSGFGPGGDGDCDGDGPHGPGRPQIRQLP